MIVMIIVVKNLIIKDNDNHNVNVNNCANSG